MLKIYINHPHLSIMAFPPVENVYFKNNFPTEMFRISADSIDLLCQWTDSVFLMFFVVENRSFLSNFKIDVRPHLTDR